MLNLLRSDLHRLVRQIWFWMIVVITVAVCVLGAALLAWVASPEFADYVNEATYAQMSDAINEAEQAEIMAEAQSDLAESETLNSKELPSLSHTWAQMFLTGGLLGIMGSLVAVLFLTSDFKGGFVRNLVMDRRGRLKYYAEKLVLVALIQVIFLAVCAVATGLAFAAYGFTYETIDTVGELAVWLILTWLLACAYAFIACIVTWFARNEWIGTACAILVSTGAVGGAISALCELLAPSAPWLANAPYLMLHGCTRLLGSGAYELMHPASATPLFGLSPIGDILLVEAVFIALCAVIALTVCRRRDI